MRVHALVHREACKCWCHLARPVFSSLSTYRQSSNQQVFALPELGERCVNLHGVGVPGRVRTYVCLVNTNRQTRPPSASVHPPTFNITHVHAQQQDPGRLDKDIKLLLPSCNNLTHTYTLRLPFSFSRLSGPVLWPPGDMLVYLNGRHLARNEDSPRIFPAWNFDPPVAANATLRLCGEGTEADNGGEGQIELHNALSFT